MSKLIPYGSYIVLKELKEKQKELKSVIIVPNKKIQLPYKGKVIAIGNKVSKKTRDIIKVGDKVFFERRREIDITFEGVEYLFVKEVFIMSKFDIPISK